MPPRRKPARPFGYFLTFRSRQRARVDQIECARPRFGNNGLTAHDLGAAGHVIVRYSRRRRLSIHGKLECRSGPVAERLSIVDRA